MGEIEVVDEIEVLLVPRHARSPADWEPLSFFHYSYQMDGIHPHLLVYCKERLVDRMEECSHGEYSVGLIINGTAFYPEDIKNRYDRLPHWYLLEKGFNEDIGESALSERFLTGSGITLNSETSIHNMLLLECLHIYGVWQRIGNLLISTSISCQLENEKYINVCFAVQLCFPFKFQFAFQEKNGTWGPHQSLASQPMITLPLPIQEHVKQCAFVEFPSLSGMCIPHVLKDIVSFSDQPAFLRAQLSFLHTILKRFSLTSRLAREIF